MGTYNEDQGGKRQVIGLFGYFWHQCMCVGEGSNWYVKGRENGLSSAMDPTKKIEQTNFPFTACTLTIKLFALALK